MCFLGAYGDCKRQASCYKVRTGIPFCWHHALKNYMRECQENYRERWLRNVHYKSPG